MRKNGDKEGRRDGRREMGAGVREWGKVVRDDVWRYGGLQAQWNCVKGDTTRCWAKVGVV